MENILIKLACSRTKNTKIYYNVQLCRHETYTNKYCAHVSTSVPHREETYRCPSSEIIIGYARRNRKSDINKQNYIPGVILIKKAGDGSQKIKGCWDSIHVVEVIEKSSGRNAHYKLTSTAMLWLQTNKESSGTMNLGGSLTRQVNMLNLYL